MSDKADRARRMLAQMNPEQARRLVGMLPTRVVVSVAPVIPGAVVGMAAASGEVVESAAVGALTMGARPSLAMTRQVGGPLVRADEPNRNGALFLLDDLRFGLASIAGQPLSVNHGNWAVGWLETAELTSQPDFGDFIDIEARVWAQRFPEVWAQTEAALAEGTGFISMECVPSAVECQHCGVVASTTTTACQHIVLRTAARRMIDPTFIGAALVLPPEKPGWPDARLRAS